MENEGFVVEITAKETRYTKDGGASSIDELLAALRAAARHRSPLTAVLIGTAIAAAVSLMLSPWLLLLVVIAGIAMMIAFALIDPRKRTVAVTYRLDEANAHAFESLGNGVGWLGSSRVLRDARVTQGSVANLRTNLRVSSLTMPAQTLVFLPDALVVRDAAANFGAIPYASIHAAFDTVRHAEGGFVPPDARVVAQTWLYANKNGSPDRRRRDNRQIPIVESGRVTLSWRGSGCEVVASNIESARRFAEGMQAMALKTTNPTAPTDLERALQASIERKAREDELARMERDARSVPQQQRLVDAWIPQGSSVSVHFHQTGDFVFVGKRVPSFDGAGIEPGAIDPALPIDPGSANTSGDGLPYWPSYASISAASRTAYLRWLAGGRKDPNVNPGYLFLFFYGLERRVYELVHKRGSSAEEVLGIAREITRLVEQHASRSNSFANYAGALLDLIAWIEPRARTADRGLEVRLGELARDGKPLPAAIAFEWMRASHALNTAATRCENEFELLFHVRYAKQFGDGIVLSTNRTALELHYRPASSALAELTLTRDDLPNVTGNTRQLDKLIELARECSSALDPFSRFLGKNPQGRESLAAFALLPDELVEGTHSIDAKALATLVSSRLDSGGRAHLGAGELLQYVRIAKPDKVSKSEATLLAQSLEKLGYGIEPDVRLGGPVVDMDGRVIVFRRLPDCPSVASDDYAAAALLVRLGAMVSTADEALSDAERALLERHIEERLQLTPGERQRLGAHLAWILEAELGMTGLKRKLEALPAHARRAVGKLLVDVAATDGRVDPREMKMLEKIYALLELAASDLYSDVHAAHAEDDGAPVVVDAPIAAKGFAIPAQTKPAASLDMSRVRLKIAETREVSALLGSIFVDEDASPAAAPAPVVEGTIGTLDAAHSELLRRLAARESWPRDEVERLAGELALMTDGALETINDYAYATANDAFWEDDDPIAINTNIARELIR